MRTTYTHAPQTLVAVRLLGVQIAAGRRAWRWTLAELAERAGISVSTLRSIEAGTPTVAIGSYFEVATLVGINLFGSDEVRLEDQIDRGRDRLALLPARVRERARPVRNDF